MTSDAGSGILDFRVRHSTFSIPSVPHPSLRDEWGTPSVVGTISFVDWTPGNTFVGGVDANYGFHAVAFDSDYVALFMNHDTSRVNLVFFFGRCENA